MGLPVSAAVRSFMLYLLVQLALLMAFPRAAKAQSTDTTSVSPLAISGYAEVYFSYDLSEPRNGERPVFLYNHRRHNEVALNLGFIKAAYNRQNVRANLALMAGTYPQYNLAEEPTDLRSVLEANVGLRLSAKRDLWLDAGCASIAYRARKRCRCGLLDTHAKHLGREHTVFRDRCPCYL